MRTQNHSKGQSRRCSILGKIRERARRLLSLALSVSMVMCSMPTIPAYAAPINEDDDVQEFTLTSADISAAIRKAMDGEPIEEGDYGFAGAARKSYEELFYGSEEVAADLYELFPKIEKDKDGSLSLRVFLRIDLEDDRELDSNVFTGEEELVFLLLNNSKEEQTARIYVDENMSGLIDVAPRKEVVLQSDDITDTTEAEAEAVVDAAVEEDIIAPSGTVAPAGGGAGGSGGGSGASDAKYEADEVAETDEVAEAEDDEDSAVVDEADDTADAEAADDEMAEADEGSDEADDSSDESYDAGSSENGESSDAESSSDDGNDSADNSNSDSSDADDGSDSDSGSASEGESDSGSSGNSDSDSGSDSDNGSEGSSSDGDSDSDSGSDDASEKLSYSSHRTGLLMANIADDDNDDDEEPEEDDEDPADDDSDDEIADDDDSDADIVIEPDEIEEADEGEDEPEVEVTVEVDDDDDDSDTPSYGSEADAEADAEDIYEAESEIQIEPEEGETYITVDAVSSDEDVAIDSIIVVASDSDAEEIVYKLVPGEVLDPVIVKNKKNKTFAGVAYTAKIADILNPAEGDTLTYEGEDYSVKVTYGDDALLPYGVSLEVSEYEKDSDTYRERILEAAEMYGWDEDEILEELDAIDAEDAEVEEDDEEILDEDLADEGSYYVDKVRIFDISLYVDGEIVEPAADVEVEFTFEDKDDEVEYKIIHFMEDNENEEIGTETEYEDNAQVITFSVSAFSDFAVVDSGIMPLDFNVTGDVGISSFVVQSQVDGQAPWDDEEGAGNDQNENNDIVRSFDYVNYTLEYITALANDDNKVDSSTIYVEFTLPCGPETASFNMGVMLWMADPELTYYFSDGTASTEYDQDNDYGKITKQVLTGHMMTRTPGDGTLSVGIYIGGAKNGTTITPSFTAWMEGNVEDDKVTIVQGSDNKQVHTLTVSAAPKYAIDIVQGSGFNRAGTFDLTAGTSDSKSQDKIGDETSILGRLEDYGVTVIVQNDSDEKGLKGLEFPAYETIDETTGEPIYKPITFDLTLSETVYGSSVGSNVIGTSNEKGWTPVIWEYDENGRTHITGSTGTGKWGRNLYYYSFAYQAAPANKLGETTSNLVSNSCYDGGGWTIVQDSENPLKYHVTINDYTIDYKDYNFPTYRLGTSQSVTEIQYKENRACLSAGNIQCIVQYIDSSELTDDSTISFEIIADNFSVGDIPYELKEEYSNSYVVFPPGSFSEGVWFGYKSNSAQGTTTGSPNGVLGTAYTAGNGYSFRGNEIRINNRVSCTNDTDIQTVIGFAKWDADAFEVTGHSGFSLNMSGDIDKINKYSIYYAVLDDGGNWDSDKAMSDTLMIDDSLTFYEDLGDIPANQVCVGGLWIGDVYWSESTFSQMGFYLTVKDDPSLIGNVYQGVGEGWISFSSIDELETQYGDLINNSGKLNANLIRSGYDNYETYCSKDVYATMGKSSSDRYYTKTEYDEDGNIVDGTNKTAYRAGDSVLICGESSTVEISTDKDVYNLDNGERTTTVTVKPYVSVDGSKSVPTEGETKTTTTTITVTLPADLTYEVGSAACDWPDFTVDYKTLENGTTVLTFVLKNVTVGEDLPEITFTCTIGHAGTTEDVENNQSISLNATIESTDDHRDKKADFGNSYSTSINIVRLSSINIGKTVDNPLVEVNGDFTWTFTFNNGSATDIKGVELADVLPFNNDTHGSNFVGTYDIDSIEVDFSQAPNSFTIDDNKYDETTDNDGKHYTGMEFLTTDNYYDDGNTLAKDGPTGEDWTDLMTATGTTDNKDQFLVDLAVPSLPSGVVTDGSNITSYPEAYEGRCLNMSAFYLKLGTVAAGETIEIRMHVRLHTNNPGNTYNNIYYEATDEQSDTVISNIVKAVTVYREIAGRIWIDENRNGIQDDGEPALTDATVSLYRKSDVTPTADTETEGWEAATDVWGKELQPITTDSTSDGMYVFASLPAATYTVVITNVDGNVYHLTQKDVGDDDTIDSDAEQVSNKEGNLIAAIENVLMPAAEDMNENSYREDSLDAGYYYSSGSVTFSGSKTIEGKDVESIQTFTFALYSTGSDFNVGEGVKAYDTQEVTGAGSFTFETIEYDSTVEDGGAGTYYYVVKETSTDENGWTMDTNEYHITVVVAEPNDDEPDADDGTYTITVTAVNSENESVTLTSSDENGSYIVTGLDFSNTYKAAETSVQFTGTKYLSNSTGTNKVFTFELYNADSSFTINDDAIDTQTTTGAGTITFKEITYSETGTYYYVIQEKALDTAEGWTIDSNVYNITVEVADNGIGQLVATVTKNGTNVSGTNDVYGGFDFTNAYAAEGEVTLSVVKSIEGVATTDTKFEFTLYNSDSSFTTGDSIEKIETDGTITNSIELNFTAIPYTKAGVYYYVIKETGTAPDGWTLDEKEYHVTVSVTDNNDGTMTTVVNYLYVDENESRADTAAKFTNTYAATGELNLTGTKTFEGGTLEENGFTFTMLDSTGASVGDVEMDASGNITFPTLKYNETDIGKEYTYIITEVTPDNSDDSSIVYDETSYTVVVSVADNEDGTLAVTYTVNGTDSGDITFTNYQKGSLTISKTFTGLTNEQIASLTNFTITVTNSKDDTVATLTLDDADEGSSYTWTVSELPADKYTVTESGYSLDGYEVIAKSGVVEVTDGADVSVDDTLAWGGEDKVEFTNKYTEVGSITITKYVVAEEDIQEAHKDTEYTVIITASPSNASKDFQWVTASSSDARDITPNTDGDKITFTITEDEKITINGLPAGSYTVEENGSDAQTSESFVPIYIVDGEETEHAPNVTVASGGDNVVEVVIENEYPIGTYIMVQKNYNKDEYPEEGFTFTIEALSCDLEAEDATLTADKMPMPDTDTVTITESGEIGYFGNIEYEHLGTYYYKITETAGSADHVDYDTSVHYIKVVVASTEGTHVETTDEYEAKADEETDDYKDLEYTEAGIVTAEFTNIAYDKLTIEKEVDGDLAHATEYEFEITLTKDGEGYTGDLKLTDADGEEASSNILNSIANWFSGIIRAFRGEDGEESEDEETVTFTDGKATITIQAGEKVTLLIPSGWDCTITEKTTGADTTTVYDEDGNIVVQVHGQTTEAVVEAGTVNKDTQFRFVNFYRQYFDIDEEIVPEETNRNTWEKSESVNEYDSIELEMSTYLPIIIPEEVSEGEFTLLFHNKLDSGLKLDAEEEDDLHITIGGTTIDPKYYKLNVFESDRWSIIAPLALVGTNDDCSFHVTVDLTSLYKDGIVTDDDLTGGSTEIVIYFYVDLEGESMDGTYTSTVQYEIYDGDEWLYTSSESVVYVYTYEIGISKSSSSTGRPLAGATFGLYYDEACTDPVIWWGEHYTVTSDEDGKVTFYGLAAGTYYLKEIEAPNGYILSSEVYKVTLGEEEINITKSSGISGDDLDGVTFEVYYDEECTTPVKQNGVDYTVTVDKDGNVTFNGLAGGTYYLKEVGDSEGSVLNGQVIEVTLQDHRSAYNYYFTVSNTPTSTTTHRSSGGGGGSGSGGSGGGSGAGGPGSSGSSEGEGDTWDLLPLSQTGEGQAMLFGGIALAVSAMALIALLWYKRRETKS